MEQNIIRSIHEKLAHLSVSKCVDQLLLHYWFPDMTNKVEKFMRNGLKCILHSASPHSNDRYLHMIPKNPVPFDTIHIDHFGPLPSIVSKRKHIVVIIDAFTNMLNYILLTKRARKKSVHL